MIDKEKLSGIKGVGCDIVSISRIEKLLSDTRFLGKVCTEQEICYCREKTSHTAAGIWAAKEAVSKALGTGFDGFTPKDIEVVRSVAGQPQIALHRGARARAEMLGIANVHISISHESEQAFAFAVAQ